MENQFPHTSELIYLNHAAVGPWPKCTYDAVQQFALENLTHGAQHYPTWIHTEHSLRKRLQWLINATSSDSIALSKSTSEALSIIAYGIDWKPGDNVVLSSLEFPSNRIVWESLAQFGVEVRVVDFSDLETPESALMNATDHNTRLLTSSSIHYANGLSMQLERLGEHCATKGILFCVDAIQSLGAFPFDVEAINADFVVADGHKWMLGPEGVALFYCRAERIEQLKLNQYGWHMVEHSGDYNRTEWEPAKSAKRFECGSPNMLGIHALNASLGLIKDLGLQTISEKIINNVTYLTEKIKDIKSSIMYSQPSSERPSGIMNFAIKPIDNAVLHRHLTKHNIICALRGDGIRLSPHYYHSTAQLDQAIDVLNDMSIRKITP